MSSPRSEAVELSGKEEGGGKTCGAGCRLDLKVRKLAKVQEWSDQAKSEQNRWSLALQVVHAVFPKYRAT